MKLRPYQQAAREAIHAQWDGTEDKGGVDKTLLVLPTGTGKTIVFSKVIEDRVKRGDKVLVLAHRGELLDQAADKLEQSTGLKCAVEKAQDTSVGSWFSVVVGSVQTLMRDKRLNQFAPDHFGTIIVDEAHHAISDSYLKVLNHFSQAKVLGVTATPDRGDMKSLGAYFESLAYEYSLPKAIKEGYLSPIKALTIPLTLDLSSVSMQSGDFKPSDVSSALDPYLAQIADAMVEHCKDKKTVVFLPLIATSQKFTHLLQARGFKAAEVNGESPNRAQILEDFDNGRYQVLCNSMLLCLDMETEILTNKGFVKHDEITMQHKVANWNFDGTVFFEEPKEIVKRPLGQNEHMTSIKSRTFDLRVTNTHKMVVACGANGHSWKKISADQLRNGHTLPTCGVAKPFETSVEQEKYTWTKHAVNNTTYHLVKTGQFNSREEARKEAIRRKEERQSLKYLQPHELSLNDCRFIGFWIADGSVCNLQKGGKEYTFSQSKTYNHIVNWFDDLISRLPYNSIKRLKEGGRKHNADYYTWSFSRGTGFGIQKREGLYRIEPYLKKDGTQLFWGLNEEQFDALVEGYWYGDGTHGDAKDGMPRSIMMNDTNKNWIDLLCTIGSVRGWRCNMMHLPSINENHKDQWGLRMIKNGQLHISHKTKINQESYSSEDVWCVRTTSKNIITRRNGLVTIMGNTEGWDCPSVDCIVVLRPTKIRSLYSQMVGRGTRLFEGKEHLLLLDFLWHTSNHDLCHPASLIAENDDVAKKMTEIIEEKTADGEAVDIEEIEGMAKEDVIREREEALAEMLEQQRRKKTKFVDPIQFEMSIQAEDLVDYVPAFGWQMKEPTKTQMETLEGFGILGDGVDSAGKASMLIDRLISRSKLGLSTPRQIRQLERRGFKSVGTWTRDEAGKLISQIASNKWRTPRHINPQTYKPGG